MELMSKLQKKETKVLYDAGHFQVIDINGYVTVQEQDMVVCIPYFIEQKKIMLRYENIPSFELIQPGIEKYVNVMSTYINKEETPSDALKRGLKNEFGIELKNIKEEIYNPIFINKGNTAKYHICILPLMEHNYELVQTVEAKKLDMLNSNILININELPNLLIYDIITKYVLDIFKNNNALVF